MPLKVETTGLLKMGTRGFQSLLQRNSTAMLNDLGMGAYKRVREPLTGSVKRDVKIERAAPGKPQVRVFTIDTKKIAIFREVNTKAHIIVPVRARVLAFRPKFARRTVFSMIVHHPGTRGTHSWQYANQQFRQRIPFALKAMFQATFNGQSYTKRYT